ncbi:hypothetical protein FRX31_017375 [Thalictrum thalictroides]|uniref:Uncharacterized protein n=1 Tax=Thalictrum thalictroides TaxID=46969 RepID=A0A7J6W893_THATH|nr:hypothetical protein FRX31_017375 [Thalictrum thalictroides]
MKVIYNLLKMLNLGDKLVLPPPIQRAPGRPKTQRIRGEDEPVKSKAKVVFKKYKRNELLGISQEQPSQDVVASSSRGKGRGRAAANKRKVQNDTSSSQGRGDGSGRGGRGGAVRMRGGIGPVKATSMASHAQSDARRFDPQKLFRPRTSTECRKAAASKGKHLAL